MCNSHHRHRRPEENDGVDDDDNLVVKWTRYSNLRDRKRGRLVEKNYYFIFFSNSVVVCGHHPFVYTSKNAKK